MTLLENATRPAASRHGDVDAIVIGSGPNGMSAANALADASAGNDGK